MEKRSGYDSGMILIFFHAFVMQPLIAQPPSSGISKSGSRNAHWDFVPSIASVAVPEAKVYLRNKEESEFPEKQGVRANLAHRHRISVNVLQVNESVPSPGTVQPSLFVVKGNPLITTQSPLPCFASGIGMVAIDFREGEDTEDLSVQVLLQDMGAHFGLPLDDVLEVPKTGVIREMTLWDTQSGSMRGSCQIEVQVEKEQPLSVAELAELRRLGNQTAPSPIKRDSISTIPSLPIPRVVEDVTPQEVDLMGQLSQTATDLLAAARTFAAPLEEKKEELATYPAPRRRRGNQNFSINDN